MEEKIYLQEKFLQTFTLPNISENLKFENCIFVGDFIFNEGIINNIRSITFENCIFEKSFIFIDAKAEKYIIDYLTFRKCKFYGEVNIADIKVSRLQFFATGNISKNDKSVFLGITLFRDIQYEKIDFLGHEINSGLNFWNLTMLNESGNISFNGINGTGSIYFDGENNISTLKFKNVNKFSTINIETKEVGEISLYNINDLKECYIGEGENRMKVGKLELQKVFMEKEEGFFSFVNIEIEDLKLFNSQKLPLNFSLSDIKINYANFSNINLGKTLFNGIDFNKLYLENVTLNECIFNGVEFPKNYELEKKELSYKKMKDNYRQLKHVMDKNGNTTEANKFFAKEMEYYMNSLNVPQIGIYGTIKRLYQHNFLGQDVKNLGEKLILIFGYSVNEFGNNWLRAFHAIFTFAFLTTLLNFFSTLLGNEIYIYKYNYFYWVYSGMYSFPTEDKISYLNNYIGDFIAVLTLIVGFIFIYRTLGTRFEKVIDKFYSNIVVVYLLVLIVLLSLILTAVFDSLKVFGNLLNPLYFKEEDTIYNGIEIMGLVFYKTIYGILLYHLIVALKRTTKR